MKRQAFSLVELVIVIVIIGIIAAIAVPRFSSATESANRNQVKSSAVILQNALDMAIAEHTGLSTETAATIVGLIDPSADEDLSLLLDATDDALSSSKLVAGDLGPYLRNIPDNLLIGTGSNGWIAAAEGTAIEDTTVGWVVDKVGEMFTVGIAYNNGTSTIADLPPFSLGN